MAATFAPIRMHVVFFQHAAVGKFDRQIQRGLSADGRQHGKTRARRHFPLDADNLFQIFERERLNISAVGDLRVGHDGRRIRVGQHHFIALRLERLAGLRAGVIKLRRLPNDDGPGAEDQDFRDVSAFGHLLSLLASDCLRDERRNEIREVEFWHRFRVLSLKTIRAVGH